MADLFQEIVESLDGDQADVADDRGLATVLFTDIVDSTRAAGEMGDVIGAPCSTHTTPSSRSRLARSGAAR